MRFPKLGRPSIGPRQVLGRLARSKLVWTFTALLLLYTLGGFLLAPYLVER